MNIFLETGKTTNFTVTPDKLSATPPKGSSNPISPADTPTLALAS